jgi:hypothetical protein
MVNDMRRYGNYGMRLRLVNEVHYACLYFASSEHRTTANHPKLVIRYETSTPFIDEIPVMKSNTYPRGIASCSSVYSSAYQAWKAFDGNDLSGSWSRWISRTGPMPQWLAYDFRTYKLIKRYYILPELGNALGRHPRDFRIQGYRNGMWTTIDTRRNITWTQFGPGKYFTIARPGYYTKYRLYVDATNRPSNQLNSGVVSIRQFKLSG